MKTFTIERLTEVAKRRHPGYLDACRACATEATETALTFDEQAECYKALASFRRSRGVGDSIAKAIQTVTFGKVTPCQKCKKRAAVLNRLLPYPPAQ